MIDFVVMVGLSGSGKSTRAKEAYPNYVILSSDEIRESRFGDVNDQSHNGQVFDIMLKETIRELKAGNSVVYDATNLSAKRRKSLLQNVAAAIDSTDLNCIAHIVVTTPENCQFRNMARERVVPAEVIHRQLLAFQCPTEMEGFNQIFIDNTESEEVRTLYMCEKVREMAAMKHENPHYPDTVFSHVACVTRTMLENALPDMPRALITQTGFYHDIGKLYTKTYDTNDVAHYYSHDAASAYVALIAPANGMNRYCRICMSAVIGWHMKEFSYQNQEKYSTWLAELPTPYRDLLVLLTKADALNSIP